MAIEDISNLVIDEASKKRGSYKRELIRIMIKNFVLIFSLVAYSNKPIAQVLSDSKLDSSQIIDKVKLIEKQFRKHTRQLIGLGFNKYALDSSIISANKEKQTNKLGDVVIKVKTTSNIKRNREIEFTFFDGEIVRILVMNLKKKGKANGGGVYYFSNGILFYKEERVIEPQNVNDLVNLANQYFQKAQKLIESSN